MDCDLQPEIGSAAYFAAVLGRAGRERVPVTGAFDLTYRCNLRCVHCYAGHLVGQPTAEATELKTDEILQLLSEAVSAGCLFLLLSGGEPLLRSDFTDIYVAARCLGLVVTVFTNATLLTQAHLDAFREYPPRMVEVSIYGATESTTEQVTGVPGSHSRTMRSIDLLQAQGVRLGLKTVMLRDNAHEIEAIQALAEERGLRFRLDPLLTPRLDGDRTPLGQRVDACEAVKLELGDPKRREDLAAFVARQTALASRTGSDQSNGLYRCRAGVSSFHLDPHGLLRPCLMSRDMAYDCSKLGFAGAWRAAVLAIDRATRADAGECSGCSDILLCGHCPGLFGLENGSPSVPSHYACMLGERRRAALEGEREVGCVPVK